MSEFEKLLSEFKESAQEHNYPIDDNIDDVVKWVWNTSRAVIKAEGKVFRVRELVWYGDKNFQHTVLGIGRDYYCNHHNRTWMNGFDWTCSFDSNIDHSDTKSIGRPYKSLEEAKAACQAHFSEQIIKNLIEVEL